MFAITRIYSDDNGDSHFETINIELHSHGAIGYLSENIGVESIVFRTVQPSYDYDFHTAPQRQYIILLDGGVIIETSLGETRTFPAGEVLLVEDTSGKGHRTKNILPIARRSVFVTF